MDALRKRLLETGKGFAAKASKANSKFDTLADRDAGFALLESMFGKEAAAVDSLKDMAQILRKLPVAEPEVRRPDYDHMHHPVSDTTNFTGIAVHVSSSTRTTVRV